MSAPRTLADWLALQERVHPKSIDLDLARVGRVAAALHLLPVPYAVITVGGTNGKGSTVAHIAALLSAADRATGAFTSPHLLRYSERIRIEDAEVSERELIDAFERIEAARGETTLTFFEYNTLAALLLFAARRVEVAVLEVGLGGRLDATNLVDADVAVLTSIGMDHRDYLGDDLESIGREKAGILRRGRPVVLGSSEMPASVFAAIAATGARCLMAGRDFTWQRLGARWSYRGVRTYENLPPSALPGLMQYANAASAIAAVEALPRPPFLQRAAIERALTRVALPGRLQMIPGPVEWLLDVAHNEPAARVLARHLLERPARGRIIAVAGILADKDAAGIARALAPLVHSWILCALPGPRGVSAEALAARMAPALAGEVSLACGVPEGCALARARAVAGDRVLVFGSFLVVGSALQWLGLY